MVGACMPPAVYGSYSRYCFAERSTRDRSQVHCHTVCFWCRSLTSFPSLHLGFGTTQHHTDSHIINYPSEQALLPQKSGRHPNLSAIALRSCFKSCDVRKKHLASISTVQFYSISSSVQIDKPHHPRWQEHTCPPTPRWPTSMQMIQQSN